jgi:anti-anti-sigma regulatory factor
VPDHIHHAAAGGDTATLSRHGDAEVLIVLRGGLDGTALEGLGSALDDAMRSGALRVHVDLSGVTHWSLLAQAMVLASARRMAGRGCRMVLRAPSSRVRNQGRRLDIFNRVTTVPGAALSPSWW